ncbi:hypothetical protein GCM10007108_01300 [Thermogymnomonas acidicola]|uniref:Thioesterase domain-containing protein n=1 Tax=Thermogymnomonas acidicola TaxID=399579 RepID=A0AA37BPV1_9ARCH|nr:PaaI family thioesterase [Thermogymnomonas acidicola]GGM66854.1 hypothetical protein GCM10007108_01300 [Thermogymnomonas acidicola]
MIDVEMAQAIVDNDAYLSRFGISVTALEKGYVSLKVELGDGLKRFGGMMNGGAVCSLMDAAGGISAMCDDGVVNEFTVNLNVNFLRPVSTGPVSVESRVLRSGKNVAFCDIRLVDGDGKLCATGTGVWFLVREDGGR